MQWLMQLEAVLALKQSKIIAYPTEAVYGLGCDPFCEQAVTKLCAMKERPLEKGLILIAATVDQILPWINRSSLSLSQWEKILATWPGPYTWIFPASDLVPSWIKGAYSTVAVRVSAHPIVQDLCLGFGSPLVSTSANRTRKSPILEPQRLWSEFHEGISGIMVGALGEQALPSTIQDACSGVLIRGGA